ncbi:hypothetical protein [Wolbachia pipientis]
MNLLYITHYPKSCATKPAGIQKKRTSVSYSDDIEMFVQIFVTHRNKN